MPRLPPGNARDEPAAIPGRAGAPALLQLAQAAPGTATDLPKIESATGDGLKLGGFYQGTFAYTYSDPVHWSRMVQRFQGTAEGRIGERVKYKLGARVDIDPLYYYSNFYLPDVEKNQRFSAVWGENYIDFEAAGWDFRIGAQNIVWGEVVGLFFADVVSARDTRDFLLPSFDIIRIPQWAVRAEYFKGDSHIEFIWIPVPTFDRIGKPGADFYPAPLPSPTSQSVASLFANPDRPSRSLSNSNYGVRANTLVGGWDVAAFYYRSYNAAPTFYRLPTGNAAQPFVFQPLYDRIWQTGGTVTKDFDSFVLRGEAVYTYGQDFATTDPTAPRGVVRRNTLDYIASVEIPLDRINGRLNVQAFQRLYFAGSADAVALDSGTWGGSVLVAGKVTPTVEPQILWIQTVGGGGGLIRPRVNWYPFRNASVGFGFDIFTGPTDGLFGRYNNRDRVYTELRYDF
ncbi:MAG: hypothetical protein N2544_16010 [Burkholderiales bacterium]|nr:hypothetical protein [Burkholderiales bacterium]